MKFEKYRAFTQARVGLGLAGSGLPTKEWLRFSFDHASAVDAVRLPWDIEGSKKSISNLGFACEEIKTRAADRETYLQRPDLGRTLDDRSAKRLAAFKKESPENVLIAVSNGLSSAAVHSHLEPFLKILLSGFVETGFAVCQKKIFLVEDFAPALILAAKKAIFRGG